MFLVAKRYHQELPLRESDIMFVIFLCYMMFLLFFFYILSVMRTQLWGSLLVTTITNNNYFCYISVAE